jgi:hypothetical protein
VRGLLLSLAGTAVLMAGGVAELVGYARWRAMTGPAAVPHPWWETYLVTPLVMVVGAFVMYAGRSLRRNGRRHRVRIIGSPRDAEEGRFVLYLRSFEDDAARAGLEWGVGRGIPSLVGDVALSGRTEEEQLIAVLRAAGRVVAAGRPGETLPQTGADRFYMADTDWQRSILDLMARARLVVIAAGSGAALLWELTAAFRTLPPERLLLLVPMEAERYAAFRDDVSQTLAAESGRVLAETGQPWTPPALPDYPPGTTLSVWKSAIRGAVWFGADRRPHFVRFDTASAGVPRARNMLYHAARRRLRPVFERLDAETNSR